MQDDTILIAIGKDAPSADLAAKFEAVGAAGAHATVIVVGEIPQFPAYALGVPPYGAVAVPAEWQDAVSARAASLADKAKEVGDLLLQHGVSGDVSVMSSDLPRIADEIARRAMLCDSVLVSEDLRGSEALFRQVVHGVLFESPVGVVLNDPAGLTLGTPRRVIVAWNPQLHSVRAVHLALPWLRAAEEVMIATVDPVMAEYRDGEDPGVDVAKWLTRHGCTVVVQQFPSGGQDVGACILERAQEYGADLIVMGAYGHSRMRQALFGGTTRTLIEQTGQTVFLAH